MEGAERINRFFQGVDLHHIERKNLNWEERIISLITGLCLMIPMINSIIWLAMCIFGTPERLSNPYVREEDGDDLELELPPPPVPQLPANAQPLKTEHMEYIDNEHEGEKKSTWQFDYFPDRTVIKKEMPGIDKSIAIYAKNGRLTFYQHEEYNPLKKLECQLVGPHLYVKGTKNGATKQVVHELKEDLPWIQQSTTGYRDFALHSKKGDTMPYYFFGPKNLLEQETFELKRMIATHRGHEFLKNHGEVLKVTWAPDSWIASALWCYHIWLHPVTGQVLRMEWTHPNPMKGDMLTTLTSNPLSPAQGHL
jgi:hypothetical protein